MARAPSSWPSDYVNLKEVQGIKTETSPVKSFGLWLKKEDDKRNDFATLTTNYNDLKQAGTLKTIVQVAGYFYSFANLNDGSEHKYCYKNSNAKSETIIKGIPYKTITCDDASLQFQKYGVAPNSANSAVNMGMPLAVVATTNISDLSNFIVVPENEFPALSKNCLELNP
ncbi:MAG: hypothetical protein O2897_04940 [bacterium]|nr:hypothetical protein [bacterium]